MPPIDLPPIRPAAPAELRQTRAAGGKPAVQPPAASGPDQAPAVEIAAPLAGSEPPVDPARVNEIRKAIESDRYPVIPMRVADALIASGLLLRSGK